jgi:uncharacterized protein YqeY
MVTENIIEQVRADLDKALKKHDQVKVSTLRLLLSALHNAEIEKRAQREKLTKEDTIKVIAAEVKKRRESIAAFKSGGRTDLVRKEQAELLILEEYLPEQLSHKQLEKIITQVVTKTRAKSIKDLGKVMGQVMEKVRGRADGKTVSKIVKHKLK